MKRFSTLTFVAAHTTGAFAQGFWAPGACWIYQEQLLSQALHLYTYSNDTLIDGYVAQHCLHRYCDVYPPDTFCYSTLFQFSEFVRFEGEVVYTRVGTQWDTLYFLGSPGDTWYPIGYEMSCNPVSKIMVTDTGHVVVDGVSLRAWDIAQLDANGLPMPDPPFGDTLRVIERIGGSPRSFPYFYCPPDIIDEESFYSLRHYSDWQISLGTGLSCDMVLPMNEMRPSSLALSPNPGTVQFSLVGISASASVEVRDPRGRLVHSSANLSENALIETSAWEIGTYFVSITAGDGTRQVLRWVKE